MRADIVRHRPHLGAARSYPLHPVNTPRGTLPGHPGNTLEGHGSANAVVYYTLIASSDLIHCSIGYIHSMAILLVIAASFIFGELFLVLL